jgi:hypothetical protein
LQYFRQRFSKPLPSSRYSRYRKTRVGSRPFGSSVYRMSCAHDKCIHVELARCLNF